MDTATPAATAAAAESSDQIVSLYAAHKKIYARSVEGHFVKWRWALVWQIGRAHV